MTVHQLQRVISPWRIVTGRMWMVIVDEVHRNTLWVVTQSFRLNSFVLHFQKSEILATAEFLPILYLAYIRNFNISYVSCFSPKPSNDTNQTILFTKQELFTTVHLLGSTFASRVTLILNPCYEQFLFCSVKGRVKDCSSLCQWHCRR